MLKSNIWSVIKATGKGGLQHGIDQTFQNTMSDVGGLVTGFLRGTGAIGKGKLDLKNVSLLGAVTRTLGWGVGRAGVTVAKPIIKVGSHVVTNTGASTIKLGHATGKLGKGIGKTFFKEATDESVNSFLGYEARWFTPHVVGIGAMAYGVAEGAGEADFNMGMMTAVNGMLDSEGVGIIPGSVNASYTPLHQANRRVNNYNADGNLTLALHNRR